MTFWGTSTQHPREAMRHAVCVEPLPCAIRVACPDDLQAVLGVHVRQGSRPAGDASPQERATWLRIMGTPEVTVYLAAIDGQVVGTATTMVMQNLTYNCAPTAFIEAVVVVSGYRRRGVATTILQHALVDLRTAGCNKVQLLSHKRHVADGAHRLYAGLGFQPEAEGFRLYLRKAPSHLA
jgi:GNAT superfamily N-acetyltransferase